MNIELLDVVLFSTYFILLFLSIFWLLVLFTKEEKKERSSKIQRTPFFSAIVPAYNEEKSIEMTLQSLVNLDYPAQNMEIIVVNDGSTDKTKEIIEQFIEHHPSPTIILLNQKNQGKAAAMNHGLTIAKGEFFACLDADSFVSSNALQVMLPLFEDNELVAAACPLIKVKKPQNVLEKVQWYEYIINMFHRFLNAKLNCLHVTPGPFSVYRTQIVKKIGGFDEHTITEDLEIAVRLQKHQYQILHTFDAIVETVAPTTWKALFRQRVRWYKGAADNTIQYKELLFNKKYGDFGMMRMPTVVLSGIIAIVLAGTLLYELGKSILQKWAYYSSINFDFLTLIRNFSLEINILTWPFAKLFIALTLAGISFFVMIYSHRIIKEKIRNHGLTFFSLASYLLVYGFFLTAVWVYIGFMYVSRRKNFWF
ncbi:MAG: glycosyltransferase [Nanoarchaeota archaeon]|nr:glycosyltransferase [Nanoarchaeota archaeon]